MSTENTKSPTSATLRSVSESSPFIGFRWFSLSGYNLISPGIDCLWPAPSVTALEAKCFAFKNRCSGIPSLNCACGIGGRISTEKLYIDKDIQQVLGIVLGWGTVRLSKTKWSAQFAQPISLIEHQDNLRPELLKVAENHALPLRLMNEEYGNVFDEYQPIIERSIC